MQRIAIWNTAFLGDTVLTLPLLRILRTTFPRAEIDFYVRQGVESLYASQEEISHVIAFAKHGKDKGVGGYMRMGRRLAERKYDLFVSAHQSPRSAFLARASKATMRIGYTSDTLTQHIVAMLSMPYTHTVPRRFNELDEIDRLLELARPICPKNIVDDPAMHWPNLQVADGPLAEASFFWKNNIHAPVIGLHPGSTWATKCWTAQGYATILQRAVNFGAQAILFAGPAEEKRVQEIIQRAGVDVVSVKPEHVRGEKSLPKALVYDASGSLSLPQLAAFLRYLNVYVSNDSGPMHMAWAQGTPVCALFGPTVRELGFFPRGQKSIVHEVPLACRPCGLHGHKACPKGHHRCMTDISVEAVWHTVSQFLEF